LHNQCIYGFRIRPKFENLIGKTHNRISKYRVSGGSNVKTRLCKKKAN